MADDVEDSAVEASLEELLAKKAERPVSPEEEEEDEEALLALGQDETREALVTRVLPMQANEFLCKQCFLVKHRTQLADRELELCRDCA